MSDNEKLPENFNGQDIKIISDKAASSILDGIGRVFNSPLIRNNVNPEIREIIRQLFEEGALLEEGTLPDVGVEGDGTFIVHVSSEGGVRVVSPEFFGEFSGNSEEAPKIAGVGLIASDDSSRAIRECVGNLAMLNAFLGMHLGGQGYAIIPEARPKSRIYGPSEKEVAQRGKEIFESRGNNLRLPSIPAKIGQQYSRRPRNGLPCTIR